MVERERERGRERAASANGCGPSMEPFWRTNLPLKCCSTVCVCVGSWESVQRQTCKLVRIEQQRDMLGSQTDFFPDVLT